MATYLKGNSVANATSYELFEKKSDGKYTSLDTASAINFEVSALGLEAGDHVLVVKAKADGYTASNYSNEVTYTAEGEVIISRTIPLMSLPITFAIASSTFDPATTRTTAYGNAKAGDILEVSEGVGCSLHKLVSKDEPPMTLLFVQSSHSETFKETLIGSWGVTTSYTFEEDMRFDATGKDLTDSSRDFTGSEFAIYNLRRNFVKGQSTPIWSYIGSYDTGNNCFPVNEVPNTLRVLVVLDVKAGDVVATTNSSYGFNLYKLTDGTSTAEEELLSGYTSKTWTSDKNQRIMAIAKNNSDTVNNMSNVDPNNVFTVTFNS